MKYFLAYLGSSVKTTNKKKKNLEVTRDEHFLVKLALKGHM